MAKTYNAVMAARNALRRAFSRSPTVQEMMKENSRLVPVYKKNGSLAKVGAREHLCNICKEWKRSRKKSKVAIDHIEPVVDPNVGFVDLNVYFARMWVDKSKLQKLCGDCHRTKSNEENYRRLYKEEFITVLKLEASKDLEAIRKELKKFTAKRLAKYPYPPEFVKRIKKLIALAK